MSGLPIGFYAWNARCQAWNLVYIPTYMHGMTGVRPGI